MTASGKKLIKIGDKITLKTGKVVEVQQLPSKGVNYIFGRFVGSGKQATLCIENPKYSYLKDVYRW